ncbi:hypothetical protein [Solibacillus sp. CAU 1738]|uniref:hypothetical protein n=1 Tax=Solibacillus sp. CAU 1738 TaxID=3140363 RepID=UPI0032607890
MNNYEKMIDELRNGEVQSIQLSKENFLEFRKVLIQDPQFKHFRGEAKQGGDIVFTFLDNART